MKRIAFVVIILIINYKTYGQIIIQNEYSKVWAGIEPSCGRDASFPGGKQNYDIYLTKYVIPILNEAKFKGLLVYSFNIEKNGEVSNAKILNDDNKLSDEFRKRVECMLMCMPIWDAAFITCNVDILTCKCNGYYVRFYVERSLELPILKR